jgi:MtfA peptidase
MELFAGIWVFFILALLAYLLYSAMKDGIYLVLYRLGLQKLFMKEADRERMIGYLKNNGYYDRLSIAGKKIFMDRLFTFMLNKEFVGQNGLLITEEMKVLISATAVQLTFGLKKFKLEYLETIYVFPTIFKLRNSKTEYKGATSPRGIMYLSWEAFQQGNADATDKINLGLHEMTHALKLSLLQGTGFDNYFASRIDIWERIAEGELINLREKAAAFLRPYGKTNLEEFFSVSVEAFFESPKAFSRELPELYQYIVFLLNQDPTNVMNDYQLAPDFFTSNIYHIPSAKAIKPSYKYNSWHWSLSLLLVGLVGGVLSVIFFSYHLILPFSFYFISFFIVGVIGLLQKRYFQEHNILTGSFFLLYSFVGFGVTIVTVLLWINFFIPITSTTHRETLHITGYSRVSGYSTNNIGFELHIHGKGDGWYNSNMLFVDHLPKEEENNVTFTYQYGLLGIKIFQGYNYARSEH